MGDLFGPGNASYPLIDNMLMLDRITEINSDGGKAGKGLILAELISTKTCGSSIATFRATP